MISCAPEANLTFNLLPRDAAFDRVALDHTSGDLLNRVVFSTENAGSISVIEDDEVNAWSCVKSLESARELQQKLLPNRCPRLPGYSLAARSTPALEVGGDHYNFLAAGGSQIGLMIADVSGKGLPAAKLAATLRSTFRTQAWGNHDPRDVLRRVNSFLRHCLRSGTFITCTYALLNLPRRRLSLARAGHEPMLLSRDGEIHLFAPEGFPLGIMPDREFADGLEVLNFDLQRGDRMLFFTDGLTEAMNTRGDEFGIERIIKIFNATNQYADAQADVGALHTAAKRFMGGAAPHDDLTMMAMRVV